MPQRSIFKNPLDKDDRLPRASLPGVLPSNNAFREYSFPYGQVAPLPVNPLV